MLNYASFGCVAVLPVVFLDWFLKRGRNRTWKERGLLLLFQLVCVNLLTIAFLGMAHPSAIEIYGVYRRLLVYGITVGLITLGTLYLSEEGKKRWGFGVSDFLLKNYMMVAISGLIVYVGGIYLLSRLGYEVNFLIFGVSFIYPLVGLILDLIVGSILWNAKKRLQIFFTKREWIVMGCVLLGVMALYSYSLLTRQHAYYWDEVLQYGFGLRMEDMLRGPHLYQSMQDVASWIRHDKTGPLANLLLWFPFLLTPKTQNAWVASLAMVIFPLLIVTYGMMVKYFLKEKAGALGFALSMGLFFSLPLMYRPTLDGYPELLGIGIGFLLILLLWEIDFHKMQWMRWNTICFVTIILALSRSQYITWIIALYATFILKSLWDLGKTHPSLSKAWKYLGHMVCFGIMMILELVIAMLPYINNVLSPSTLDNSFWCTNGLTDEMLIQARWLGYILTALFVGSMVVALFVPKTRAYALYSWALLGITWLLFHSLVSLDTYNHSLVLLPSMGIAILFLVGQINRLPSKRIVAACSIGLVGFGIVILAHALLWEKPLLAPYTSSISFGYRVDQLAEIREVADWIDEQCTEPASAYFIPHGFPYNPDVFRQIKMPDQSVKQKLTYGSAVYGYHDFPKELLTAKYVLTSNPFCEYSKAGRYNELFFKSMEEFQQFTLVRTFDMGDGYHIYAYERIKDADAAEIEFYRGNLKEECETYPDRYTRIFDELLEECSP